MEGIIDKVQILTASNPKRKIHVVGLDGAAFREDGRCVVLGYEVEDVLAACHFEVPSIAHWIAINL